MLFDAYVATSAISFQTNTALYRKMNFICVYILLRPIKKIPVFMVTRLYLNLLVKPRFILGFLAKNLILCILKGKMPFRMHKIINFFFRKNN